MKSKGCFKARVEKNLVSEAWGPSLEQEDERMGEEIASILNDAVLEGAIFGAFRYSGFEGREGKGEGVGSERGGW